MLNQWERVLIPGYIILGIGTVGVVFYTWLWWRERAYLRQLLHSILGSGKISSKEDLIRLKNHLTANIRFDVEKKHASRPLLRHTAKETLESSYGFCGENARTAVLMLQLGGLRANRLYLIAKEWQHVVVEHKWNGGWVLFDAHADENTLLPDEDVTRIASSDLANYPNKYEGHPWLSGHRIKLFHNIPFLRFMENIRLPQVLVVLFESPYLIKLVASLVVALIGTLLVIYSL